MFYNLKTRRCVSLNTADSLISLFPFFILITKEYIIKDRHLNFAFKLTLHFSKLVIKLFNSATKLF